MKKVKKIFKSIFIYLTVLLLTVVATAVFCGGFLFFYREGSIFGIKYIKLKQTDYVKASEEWNDSVTGIEVNASGYEVTVRVGENDILMGAIYSNVFGYVRKSKAQAKIELTYNDKTNVAVFNVTEPSGWISKKGSEVQIAIPKNMADYGLDIKVNTGKGNINIGGNKALTVGLLDVGSAKGKINLDNIEIQGTGRVDERALKVYVGSGQFNVSNSCKSYYSGINCEIVVDSGVVDFRGVNNENFIIRDVYVKELKKGTIVIDKLNVLYSDSKTVGGKIVINELSGVKFEAIDTSLSINKINRQLSTNEAYIKIDGLGNVEVKEAVCNCGSGKHYEHFNLEVTGENGNVNIANINGTISVDTNHGDININNVKYYVLAVSDYGNINIRFKDDSIIDMYGYDEIEQKRSVSATTKNGHINIYGLDKGIINATDKGRITLNYHKVVMTSEINAKIGTVDIVVPNPPNDLTNIFAFNLSVNSETVKDIKVGAVGQLGEVNYSNSDNKLFTNIYNSGSSTNNNLNVTTTTGFIKIRSADLVNF